MKNGKLIVIEGSCDCVGKSTQKELIEEKFNASSIDYVSYHFPSYNTPQGKPVEMYLNGELGDKNEVSPYLAHALFALDRSVTWNETLKKEYEQGKIILLDRYTTSSLIYQGTLFDNIDDREKFLNHVSEYEYELLKTKEPDLVIFLNVPFEVVELFMKKRAQESSRELDSYEKDLPYLKKVTENANMLAERYGWSIVDYMDNGRIKTIEEINEEVTKIIEERLDLHFKQVHR